MKHAPPTFTELQSLRRPMRNTYHEHRRKLTRLEKAALFVTEKIGSMGFFFIILGWTVIWLGWNVLGPASARFDPYPAFALWLFISNMIQLLLMPLIMIGQNLQGKHSEIRAQADFDVNTKAEREIEAVVQHLENQQELMLKILERLERSG